MITDTELKLKGVPQSLSTLVRKRNFYELGKETYMTLKSMEDLTESDFVYRNRFVIK